MAFTRCTLILTILCFILIQELEINGGNQPIMVAADDKIDCAGKCSYRCSKSPPDADCPFLCDNCCKVCNCVPSGTAGNNRNECPCYEKLANYFGKPYCP
ncbi:hypothetical protein TanjilG_08284 [Lupinus angustifolius]|uniref:Uncharacterized protein n=1 Tax=Lupinus angustifolius TaxID=3871 RepID=A0A394D9Y4_LUPAN|nr:PREDICTED: peamaclein-like [Lupinus angustifolius]OIW20310.1 hypothetical protein TanjilG_08284 [Lupinus angustifolius]